MNKKILLTLVVLFTICCAGIVSAVNETNETLQTTKEPIDAANYIMPTAISGNQIKFSDGFTGFCIDLTKDSITTEDGFTVGSASDAALENYIKLAIIECYRQNRENDLEEIVTCFVDGSYQSRSDDVISEVLNSGETIGSKAVEDIDNTTEATFTFEHLTCADDKKSDCIAYAVSMKTVEKKDTLGAIKADSGDDKASSDENTSDNKNAKSDDSDAKKQNNINNENAATSTDDTIINETNKTIINKTNTVTINEKNTTVINKTNVKHINNAKDSTPHNDTIQEKIMKTAGNPIFILVVVAIIAVIAAVVVRRKD